METPYKSPDSNLTQGYMLNCSACGNEIHSSASSCPKCGASRRSARYKSKGAAAAFAFLLGGFGGHRFYLGQWWGIFYLLLFWLWIPGLIALGEFIYFLVCDQRKWDEKYNEGIPAGPNEKGGSGIVIAIIACVFVFLIVIGILAAVALPAYQDYTIRARVNTAIVASIPVQSQVKEYYINNNNLPLSNSDIQLEEPHIIGDGHKISISSGDIIITFRGTEGNILSSKTLIFSPSNEDSSFSWTCTNGTLENRHRPQKCRSRNDHY